MNFTQCTRSWIILPFFLLLILLPPQLIAQRASLSMDGLWRFAIDTAHEGISRRWFAELPARAVRSVEVPHTWNVEPGLEEVTGPGWYEREVTIPADWKGRTVRIQFDAVYHSAEVWVNGQKAGEHRGSGYVRFSVDITHLVRPGEKNRVVVRADNSFSRSSIPFMNSFDWPLDGGIIRSVRLVATTRPALSGLRVRGMPEEEDSGMVRRGTARIQFSLLDAAGLDPQKLMCDLSIREENQSTSAIIHRGTHRPLMEGTSGTILIPCARVRLWNMDTPALYRLGYALRYGGKVTDTGSVTFGFRDLRTQGTHLVLNGDTVRLMGVEWMPGSSVQRGMAESRKDMEDMLRKMRGVNAVFTRFHWQQDDAVFDWCDRHGILVQEEVPFWGYGTPLNDTLLMLGKQHLDEMIAAHYNHPSIVMWGVGNELASRERRIINGVKILCAHARSLDDSRLINYVSNQLASGSGEDATNAGDVLMFNEYQDTWYLGDPARVGEVLDSVHAAFPLKPLVISEYGLCEPANQGGDARRIRDLIYHSAVHENRAYVAGAIYFCLNDYRTHYGEAGTGRLRQRVHGVFDLEGNPKGSAEILTMLSSPVELLNIPWWTGHKLEVVVIGSAGLPSYPLRGYRLYWSEPGKDFRTSAVAVDLPAMPPRGSVNVPLDQWPSGRILCTIVRPSGEVVLQREFSVSQ
jgi:Glycosyl hydrolases family 2, sugar binding domain/Glycosyl hydrolases family 2, TIM barrel domain/Glycosyl hydrolases family 2